MRLPGFPGGAGNHPRGSGCRPHDTGDRIYDLIAAFIGTMRPFECRFVLTCGELTAGLKGRRSTGIDGPAFHRADAIMKTLKGNQERFAMETGFAHLDGAIPGLVNLLLGNKGALTGFQSRAAGYRF